MVILNQGGNRSDEKISDSVYILKTAQTEFADELDMESRHPGGF